MSVSLIMIARNEARSIARALRSVSRFVEAMIVVDTGSSDGTIDIARAEGAQIHSFPWINDFSAARNYAIERATTDWCFVLDADEYLVDGGDYLQTLPSILPNSTPPFIGMLSISSELVDQLHWVTWLPRLLPQTTRYRGVIHEQPIASCVQLRTPLKAKHDGYLPEQTQRKTGRNIELLKLAIGREPADPYLGFQLGAEHCRNLDFDEAIRYLQPACETLSRFDKPPAYFVPLILKYLTCLQEKELFERGAMLAETVQHHCSESPDFFFTLGGFFVRWAAAAPQFFPQLRPLIEAAFLRCLQIGERTEQQDGIAGSGSYRAAHNLAVLYETSAPEKAEHYRSLAGHEAMRCVDREIVPNQRPETVG